MTVAASGAVTVTATGSGLVSASLAAASGTIGGIVGGAAGGFVGGAAMSAMAGQNGGQILSAGLKGAGAGAIMGGIEGYYGNSWSSPLQRIGVTTLGSGLASKASGGDFRRGAEIGAVVSTLAWIGYEGRQAAIESSKRFTITDPDESARLGLPVGTSPNIMGESDSWWGDGYKIGGGRFRRWLTWAEQLADPSPLGGVQGGHGTILRFAYGAGSFGDNLVETFAGIHDQLNSWYWYDALGNAKNLTGWAARFGELLNKADVLIASPVAASTAINHFGAFAPLYNPPPHG